MNEMVFPLNQSMSSFFVQVELKGPDNGPPRSLLDSSGNFRDKYSNQSVDLTVQYMYSKVETSPEGSRIETSETKSEKLSLPLVKTGRMPFTINIAERFETITINVSAHKCPKDTEVYDSSWLQYIVSLSTLIAV